MKDNFTILLNQFLLFFCNEWSCSIYLSMKFPQNECFSLEWVRNYSQHRPSRVIPIYILYLFKVGLILYNSDCLIEHFISTNMAKNRSQIPCIKTLLL